MNSRADPDGQGQSGSKKFAEWAVDSALGRRYIAAYGIAQMAELVDALVSGTSAARRGGSSPLLGTKPIEKPCNLLIAGFFLVQCGRSAPRPRWHCPPSGEPIRPGRILPERKVTHGNLDNRLDVRRHCAAGLRPAVVALAADLKQAGKEEAPAAAAATGAF